MFFHSLLLVALAARLGRAIPYYGPELTAPKGHDGRGATPLPTLAPVFRDLSKRDLLNTCGYLNGNAQTCDTGFCAFPGSGGPWGCCGISADGSYTSNCGDDFPTTCVGLASSSLWCGSSACGSKTADCGYPEHSACVTLILTDLASNSNPNIGRTSYLCGLSEAILRVSATLVRTTSTSDSGFVSSSSTFTTFFPPYTYPAIVSSDTSTSSTTSSSVTLPINLPTSSSSVPRITSATAVAASGSTSTTPTPSSSGNSKTSTTIGGAVGGVAGIVLISAVISFIIYRIRVKRREAEYTDDFPEMTGMS